jgi:hypothetical protein
VSRDGLAIHQGQRHQILPVQEQQIEQEEDQRTLTGIAGVLDRVERCPPIGEHTAKLSVEISILRR